MFKKIPISAADLFMAKVLSTPFFSRDAIKDAKEKIAGLVDKKHIVFMNSGLSCFYSILCVLKDRSDKREVILPAYTAGSLVVAVKKADLKPVLCDINMNDFNMDYGQLEKVVSDQTLCIVGVHMFGVLDANIDKLKNKYPDCFIIEDSCQSMGGRISNQLVSESADVSLFSFNKGKNISTFGGGCIATDNLDLVQKISKKTDQLKRVSVLESFMIFIKMIILSIVVNPLVYGMLYPLISRFKDTKPPEGILIKDYSNLQAVAVLVQLEAMDDWSSKRWDNVRQFSNGLKNQDDLILPAIKAKTKPAFNRMPIVFKDLKKKEKAEKILDKHGFETSRMYSRPLHKMFDIGYKPDDFPNANYFAEHVLTIPCHPLLSKNDIQKIIELIKKS